MSSKLAFKVLAAVLPIVVAQQIGTDTPEVHPSLPTWKCTTAGGCVEQNTSIALDWSSHWIHEVGSDTSCTTSSGGLDPTLCGTEEECGTNCAIEGANYTSSGISVSGDALTVYQYVETDGTYSSASPRLYLLGDDGDYVLLQLLGQELSFTVDVSTLVCGENGALYLAQMDGTGGRSQYNPGGALFGSGYCDAQCSVGTWYNGSVNTAGTGACCNEMDIWEANANATALTPHPCEGQTCDPSGCGFNPYGQGDQSYYGPGGTVNTLEPFTVVTQFYTNDNTTTGTLVEIRRLYVQNGVVIQNAVGTSGIDSITASWCDANDAEAQTLGGLTTIGEALSAGMVLIFSIWNDAGQFMNWLDEGSAGPCSSTAGNPSTIEAETPFTHTTWSQIKWGDIGSTFSGTGGTGPVSSSSTTSPPATSTSTPVSTATSSQPAGPQQTHWGQCGGNGYTGPSVCASPFTCQASSPYYSQCL